MFSIVAITMYMHSTGVISSSGEGDQPLFPVSESLSEKPLCTVAFLIISRSMELHARFNCTTIWATATPLTTWDHSLSQLFWAALGQADSPPCAPQGYHILAGWLTFL